MTPKRGEGAAKDELDQAIMLIEGALDALPDFKLRSLLIDAQMHIRNGAALEASASSPSDDMADDKIIDNLNVWCAVCQKEMSLVTFPNAVHGWYQCAHPAEHAVTISLNLLAHPEKRGPVAPSNDMAEVRKAVEASAIQIIGKGSFRKVKLVNVGTWKEGEEPVDEWKPWNIAWIVVDLYEVLNLLRSPPTEEVA